MRFIDVTRYGGVKTLRVNEDVETVEARAIDEGFITVEEVGGEPLPPIDQGDVQKLRHAPARKGKRK